jgi:hypothetical protein
MRRNVMRILSCLELSQQWRQAQVAREFLSALEGQTLSNQAPIRDRGPDEWLNWARESLIAHNPLCGGAEGLWQNLAAVTDWDYQDR